MSRLNEPGWTRIGRMDDADRRALWLRESPGVVELCAGREGADAYVKITDEHAQFRDIEDVLSRARFAVEYAPEHDRTIEEAIARVCDGAGVADANNDGVRLGIIERIRLLDDKIQTIEMVRDIAGAERTRAHDVLDSMSVTPSPSLEQRLHELARRPMQLARRLGVPDVEVEPNGSSDGPSLDKLAELINAEMHCTIEHRMREAMAMIEEKDRAIEYQLEQRRNDDKQISDLLSQVEHITRRISSIDTEYAHVCDELRSEKSKHRATVRKMRAWLVTQLADLHGQIDAYEQLLQENGL